MEEEGFEESEIDVRELSANAYRPDCLQWSYFNELVAFAKKHSILIIHDNPYSFILNEHPMSMLSVPGAKDVVIGIKLTQ